MSLFPWFPFTNFHELNLDWIVKKLKGYDDDIAATNARQEEIDQKLDDVEGTIESVARSVIDEAIESGEFTQQFEELLEPIEDDMAELQRSMTTLTNNMNTLVNTTFPTFQRAIEAIADPRLHGKNLLIIGGSNTTGEADSGLTPYPARIAAQHVFKNVWTAGKGGAGFTGKKSDPTSTMPEYAGSDELKFQNVLANWVSNNQSKIDQVDIILVCGGWNDIYSSYGDIRDAISNFATYCYNTFPKLVIDGRESQNLKANIYLAFIGWCGKRSSNSGNIGSQDSGAIVIRTASSPVHKMKSGWCRRKLARMVEPAYAGCSAYGMNYLGSAIGCFHNYKQDFLADGYHISNTGHINLTKWLMSKLAGGDGFVDQYSSIECSYNSEYTSPALEAWLAEDPSHVKPSGQVVITTGSHTDKGIFINQILNGEPGTYFPYTAMNDVGTSQATMSDFQMVFEGDDRTCILPAQEIALPCFIRGTFKGEDSATAIIGTIRFYINNPLGTAYSTDADDQTLNYRIGVAIVPSGGKVLKCGNTYNCRVLTSFLPYEVC